MPTDTDCLKDSILTKMLDTQPKLKFEELDKELEKHNIPKDISKIIFSYYRPICDDCDNCCNLCSFYCFYQCLRQDNRNVCCSTEYHINSRKYNLTKNTTMDEVSEEEDIDIQA